MSCVFSPSCTMTPESDADSPSAVSSPSLQGQANDIRATIRQLLGRYSREEINRLVEEEASSSLTGHIQRHDAAGSYSFRRDGQSPQSAVLKLGGTSCSAQGPTPQRTTHRKSSSSKRPQGQPNSDKGSVMPCAPQKTDYACGLCAEEDIRKTCTRRNDLRRHIENFHNKNAVWFCQHPGCKMAYDWQGAYQLHLRSAHGRSHMNMDEAMIKVCPQIVFACGFENCTRVFESCGTDDAGATLKNYSGHVVKHFEEGSNSGRWSYSTRLRNLLRQSQVATPWERAWPEMERPMLQWKTQTSMAARKTLEAGHLERLPLLIRFLIILGSDGGHVSKLEGRLELPVRERCPAPYSHGLSLDTHAHSTLQRDLERDGNQFTISGHIGLEYGPMQPTEATAAAAAAAAAAEAHQQPQSAEAYNAEMAERIVDRTQGQQRSHSNAVASLQRLTPPPHHLFFHDPSSTVMFSQSPAATMLPTALQPLQHSAGQYVALTQDVSGSVINPAAFHGMQPPRANLASGMGSYRDAAHSSHGPADMHASCEGMMGGEGHYSLMTMHASSPSLSAERYDQRCGSSRT